MYIDPSMQQNRNARYAEWNINIDQIIQINGKTAYSKCVLKYFV